MLRSDWATLLPILETLMPFLQLVMMPSAQSKRIDKDSRMLRKYYLNVLNGAFDKLTRAIWPSVTYWTLNDWFNMGASPLMCKKFHHVRWKAVVGELNSGHGQWNSELAF